MQYGNASLAEMERESGVTYQVRLSNGCRIRAHVFVVYDEAKEVTQPPSQPGGKSQKCYRWPSVSRAQCKKGCQVGAEPSVHMSCVPHPGCSTHSISL